MVLAYRAGSSEGHELLQQMEGEIRAYAIDAPEKTLSDRGVAGGLPDIHELAACERAGYMPLSEGGVAVVGFT
jgi:hypothetical protein